jgi:hypothetical protein
MSESYESIIFLRKSEAVEALKILKSGGESAALKHLRTFHRPGEGTLVSQRGNPWKDGDKVFREGKFILYYNLDEDYIGLVCRVL